MLTDNQLEMLGDEIVPLYQELEREVIADIARRVRKTGRYTETAELMAKAMNEKGASTQKIRSEVMKLLKADDAYKKEVANNTKQYKRDVIHLIRQTEKEAKKRCDMIIANAGNMAFNKDLSMWHQAGKKLTKDSAFVQLVDAMKKHTYGTLNNITKSTGFSGPHSFTATRNAYTHYLDVAIMKMSSGTFSFDRAVDDFVREMAHSGMRSVSYASGRTYQLDTAARMCIRTASSQLAGQITMKHCDDMGTDLVEVNAHWGARPDHAVWQGKVYSRSGKNKNYPDFKVCRYGEVDGLKGVNCGHDFYPFFEGISTPNTWEPEPTGMQYNGKEYTYYQATQKQRQMENDIRKTKREIESLDSFGGDTTELQALKRKQIAEYHKFSNAVGIRAKDNRLRYIRGSGDKTRTNVYRKKHYGALNDKNDPLGKRRRSHAEKYYNALINRKKEYVINAISKNTGIRYKVIKSVYNHVFIDVHMFKNGEIKKFDYDYDMSESFRRLLDGKDIKKHDITLIKHERLEFLLMKKYNMVYEDAHKIAESKYNYSKELNDFLRGNN